MGDAIHAWLHSRAVQQLLAAPTAGLPPLQACNHDGASLPCITSHLPWLAPAVVLRRGAIRNIPFKDRRQLLTLLNSG